ncbi:hypothetical protein GYB22_03115 [bacterium]|nr:hypothetical protein [bacterium]
MQKCLGQSKFLSSTQQYYIGGKPNSLRHQYTVQEFDSVDSQTTIYTINNLYDLIDDTLIYRNDSIIFKSGLSSNNYVTLFDFNLETGDTFILQEGVNVSLVVDSIRYRTLKKISLRHFYVSEVNGEYRDIFIDRVGSLNGGIYPVDFYAKAHSNELVGMCFDTMAFLIDESLKISWRNDCEVFDSMRIVGVSEVEVQEIRLHPNPAKLTLTISSVSKINEVWLMNQLGIKQEIEVFEYGDKTQVKLLDTPAGLYHVIIRLEDGRVCYKTVMIE